jgi:REP element-mobilizing transposase RayT
MPVRKEIAQKDGVYFITFTCTNWLPLLHICNGYDVVYKWFGYLKTGGHYIIGYIIMPNHVHALVACKNTGKSINTIVANGKRFAAYKLVKRLEEGKKSLILEELQKGLNNTERREGKK